MAAKKKKTARRSPASLSSLDDVLKREGKLEKFEAVAIKEFAGSRNRTETVTVAPRAEGTRPSRQRTG